MKPLVRQRMRMRKGQWVRYTGIAYLTNGNLGQVNHDYPGDGLVGVTFIDGKEYGCYYDFVTPVTMAEAAVEVARLALNIGDPDGR